MPQLKRAPFETVLVVVGRDSIDLTESGAAWRKNHGQSLFNLQLDPLSRREVEEVARRYGVRGKREIDAACNECKGNPFLLELFLGEVEGGVRTVRALMRFERRITRWITDQQREWLRLVCRLEQVDESGLAAMLEARDRLEGSPQRGGSEKPRARGTSHAEVVHERAQRAERGRLRPARPPLRPDAHPSTGRDRGRHA
jgi:hypothetical protein